MTANELPFSLTNDSLGAWLDKLASQPPANAANQLNQALKQLRSSPAEPAQLLPLFVNLTPPCLLLANSLSPTNLAEADHKLTGKSIKIAKLVAQMLRQLALGFCMLAESGKLDGKQNQQAIYYGLQLIGYCLRSYHALYEIPSPSLWKKTAALYQLATENHCLEQSQAPKLHEFKAQPTIAAVLKRNLLFSLFKPTHYAGSEINLLFQLASQHYDMLDLDVRHGRDFGYYWNLDGEEPAVVKHAYHQVPEGFLALDCSRLALGLQQAAFETKLKPATQAKLALQLSHYEDVFNSMQIGSSSVYQLLIGFAEVGHYFQEQDKLAKILSLSTGGRPQIRRMGLVPMDKDKDYFESRHIPNKAPLPYKKVNLMRTNSNRFAIIQSRILDCGIGDVALLYKEQQPPALAVIRQMTTHDLTGDLHVLLEYVPGSYSIFAFTSPSGADSHALVINGETDHPEAFLPPDKYSVDSKLALKHGFTLHLKACLEYNANFVHFKIAIIDS